MRDAFVSAGEDPWIGPRAIAHSDPLAYAMLLRGWAQGDDLPGGWVPSDEFWIVDDDLVLGECGVRHRLTPELWQLGGHIGYIVDPAYRNRGIATLALRECLKVLAAIGVAEALVTCDDTNAASARVIEKCGGRRIDDSGPRRRYLIPLPTP